MTLEKPHKIKEDAAFKIFSGLNAEKICHASKHNKPSKAAVIAHYYYEPIWDDSFLDVLACVTHLVDYIVIVTTRIDMPDLPHDLSHIELIRRPNIGYDFYSYRVGLTSLLKNNNNNNNSNISGVFILNSSFILLNTKRFLNTLASMCDDNKKTAIRAVTASSQIAWHLQSYLLYFDIKKLPPNWLQHFFESVQPANSKNELIVACEIGLGQAIAKQKIATKVLFKPSLSARYQGTLAWIKKGLNSPERFHVLKPKTWKNLGGINWGHFAAHDIAEQFGLIKAEVLCANPIKLPLDGIMDHCEPERLKRITKTADNIKKHLAHQKRLRKSKTSEGFKYQLFESKTARKQDTKIAVIVHLYYLDLLEEILNYLKNIQEPFDLYITTPFEADIRHIFNILDAHNQSVTIMLIENRGRDIAPFIALYQSELLSSYSAILKLHS
ncbi:MAG: rhamnan synthesis F family protein, partial [Legionella sp.]|nr:rhamnan synthesis F family protein [Legionella sp.]